jgi:hypothetical protein
MFIRFSVRAACTPRAGRHHLVGLRLVLRGADLKRFKESPVFVRHRRSGRETHYRAQPKQLEPVVQWLRDYGAFWQDRLDRLDSLLERMDP